MEIVEDRNEEEKEDERRPLLLIILVALLLFLISLICLFIGTTLITAQPVEAMPIEFPVHSTLSADYQPVPYGTRIPNADLNLIKEALSDTYFFEDKAGVEEVFEDIEDQLKTPVSTATPYASTPEGSTLQPTPTLILMTNTPLPTSTSPATATLPPTNTPPVYIPPTSTPVPPTPTYTFTPIPTNTFTPTPTHTPPAPTVLLILTPNTTNIAEPGGNITYELSLQNTSSTTIEVVSLVDDQLGNLNGVGTCNTAANPYPTALATGATYICYFNTNVFGSPGYVYTNQVTGQVLDTLSRPGTGNASASVTVTDVLPSITASKTAGVPSVVEPGAMVSYTVQVNNTSVEPVTLTQLTDDKAGDLNGVGTCATGGTIGIGGSYSCVFSFMASGTAGEIFINTITAWVEDDEGNAASQSASASVNIIAPILAAVSGQVRLDADHDGDLGDPDSGIGGVTVELSDGVCTLGFTCPSTTTAADGTFLFPSVVPGSYTLVETDLAGYYSTADSSGANDNQIPVTVLSGVDSTGHIFLDAACSPPDPVNGYVTGVAPANGAVVSYLGSTTIQVTYDQLMALVGPGSVLSAANYGGGVTNTTYGGVVPFSSLSYDPGTNTVTLTLDTTDPDWLPGSTYQLDVLSTVQNTCGQPQVVTVTRAFSTMSAIAGQVRNDTDRDGDLSDPDAGIAGVTIELELIGSCTLGVDCATTTTDANGYYAFYDLVAGNYAVHEYDLPGYTSTNDANGFNFNRIPVTLGAAQYVTGMDFLDVVDCTGPDPVTGYVVGSIPVDGATGVSPGITTITVFYDQPMRLTGGNRVTNPGRYSLRNVTQNRNINILSVVYDEPTYVATIMFDSKSAWWIAGDNYEFTIEQNIQNACNVNQGVAVVINFQIVP